MPSAFWKRQFHISKFSLLVVMAWNYCCFSRSWGVMVSDLIPAGMCQTKAFPEFQHWHWITRVCNIGGQGIQGGILELLLKNLGWLYKLLKAQRSVSLGRWYLHSSFSRMRTYEDISASQMVPRTERAQWGKCWSI